MNAARKPRKPYWEMDAKELAAATREFDREIEPDEFRALGPEKQRIWQRLQKEAITLRSGSRDEVASLRNVFAMAIDLGFAKQKRSCGLAWRAPGQAIEGKKLRFGECVKLVPQLLKGQLAAVLIIEAPLSGLFSAEGCPIERGDFEKRQAGGKSDRYWYSGPGAATCLAAVFFLRQLFSALNRDAPGQAATMEIVLYEGFETFKLTGTDHERDARLLLSSFLGLHECDVIGVNAMGGQAVVTVMEVVREATSPSVPPAIIIPKKPLAA